jgi:pyridoxamine 5'-phosphate oxidase
VEARPASEPEELLGQWLAEARAAGAPLPEAMALATTRSDGSPAVRMVLLRQLGPGLVFFTDTESDKGADLGHESRAAVVLHWHAPVHRQVRASGPTSRVSDEEADRYWATRPTGARRSAAASHQSSVIADKDALLRAVAELQRRYGDDVPRPGRWSGYRLLPDVFEFWEEGPDRLHDRTRYRRDGQRWNVERLSP